MNLRNVVLYAKRESSGDEFLVLHSDTGFMLFDTVIRRVRISIPMDGASITAGGKNCNFGEASSWIGDHAAGLIQVNVLEGTLSAEGSLAQSDVKPHITRPEILATNVELKLGG